MLMRISVAGGAPGPVTRLDATKGEINHAWPSFLPDGRHFLFTVYATEPANAGVFIGSLDSPRRWSRQVTGTGLHSLQPRRQPDGAGI